LWKQKENDMKSLFYAAFGALMILWSVTHYNYRMMSKKYMDEVRAHYVTTEKYGKTLKDYQNLQEMVLLKYGAKALDTTDVK
jgi:hypothetical protein